MDSFFVYGRIEYSQTRNNVMAPHAVHKDSPSSDAHVFGAEPTMKSANPSAELRIDHRAINGGNRTSCQRLRIRTDSYCCVDRDSTSRNFKISPHEARRHFGTGQQ